MKTVKKNLKLFTLCTLILATIPVVQAAKTAGYVVTNEGDTLNGQVYFTSVINNELKVKFEDKNSLVYTFKVADLRGYGFLQTKYNEITETDDQEWIIYERKTVENPPLAFMSTTVFVKKRVSGAVNLYSYYTASEGETVQHFFYIETEETGSLLKVTPQNYKAILLEILRDFEGLHSLIGTKGFSYKHIPEMITAYNKFIINGEMVDIIIEILGR